MDRNGAPTIVSGAAGDGDRGSHVLFRREPFHALARANDLEPLWTAISERRATIERRMRHHRYNGLLWFDGATEREVHRTNHD